MTTTALHHDDVRHAAETLLDRPVGQVSFDASPVDEALRIHSVTAAVLRVRGTADGEPFSLVVKQTRLGRDADPGALWVSGTEEEHRGYWKREWLAYVAGLRYISVLATQAEIANDPDRAAGHEQRWGRPRAAILTDRARVVERAVALAVEALH